MSFYKLPRIPLVSPVPIIERISIVENVVDDKGFSVSNVVYKDVDVTSPDYVASLPTREEYTLSNLLASGVPLDQIDTSHFLDNKDIASLQNIATSRISSIVEDLKNNEPQTTNE